jgi:hypothetical protein
MLGALVGPVWSPPTRAPDPTLPTAVWPCLLPAGHSLTIGTERIPGGLVIARVTGAAVAV